MKNTTRKAPKLSPEERAKVKKDADKWLRCVRAFHGGIAEALGIDIEAARIKWLADSQGMRSFQRAERILKGFDGGKEWAEETVAKEQAALSPAPVTR